ncbi:MAG: PAS domain-containing protein [Nitrospirae bacterium]|nr:PAS domain-containing protein [Nitrospirota bacterium]
MTVLPPLRKKILRGYLAIVALFGVMGIFLILSSVFIMAGITPKMIHSNYDSIEAARKMQQAWMALHFPVAFPSMPNDAWIKQFDDALSFEKSNITEPGEDIIAARIERIWDQWKQGERSGDLVREMNNQFEMLTSLNEKGMFQLVVREGHLRRAVVIGTALFYIVTFVITLLIVDSLSVRLAKPLKDIAEVLRSRIKPGDRLKLPEPTSLEVRILNEELSQLWERVSRADQLHLEKIVRQRNQLETLLSSVEDAVIAMDNKGRVTHVNSRMAHLIGLGTESIIGMLWEDLPAASDNYFKLREVLREREIESAQIFELDIQKEGLRSYEARIREVHSVNGELISTIFLLHDVTEVRQRERLKAEFIGVLSHELKTPLQSLGTAIELLAHRKESFDERTQFLVETLMSDVNRIREVANQFIQVDRLPGAAIHIHTELARLSELLPEWLKPFELLAAERGVSIRYEKGSEGDIWAQIDQAKFPWVISNLLTNSIRVSPKGTTIEVILAYRGDNTEITVTNQGPKIPEDIRRRMFDPYFKGTGERADATHAPGYLGLGLTIVKEVTDAHGGRVEYSPLEPVGSCFRVLLPLLKGEDR